MGVLPLPHEFWFLLSIFIHRLASSSSSSSSSSRPLSAAQHLHLSILPLLHRLDFISQCPNLEPLQRILHSLSLLNISLPFSTRTSLATSLIRRALTPSSACSARELLDCAKRVVDCNFYALRGAIENAKAQALNDQETDSTNNTTFDQMLCLIEEEVCWHICDERHLLQYIMEDEKDDSDDRSDAQCSRLAGFLKRGLQSQNTEARLQALNLAVACSFHSYTAFTRLLPIFETSLYLEDFPMRQFVLSALADLTYMHHSTLRFQAICHLILPFLYAPTPELQLAAVVGCGRLLLFDCFPDETECLLSAMFERYVWNSPETISKKNSFQPVLHAMHIFFKEYSGGKTLHQDEIANTLVYMCLENIEDGLVLVGNDTSNPIQDNPNRQDEAQSLHLALRFGLSISSNISDAIAESLVLNLNEQLGLCLLTKGACLTWLHLS